MPEEMNAFTDGMRLGALEEAMDWVKASMADTNKVVRESRDLLISMQDLPARVKTLEERLTSIEGVHQEERGRYKAVHVILAALGAGVASPELLKGLSAILSALHPS